MKIKNEFGVELDWNAAINLMDNDICESLHNQFIEDEQEFFDAYCKAHTEKYNETFELAKPNPCW